MGKSHTYGKILQTNNGKYLMDPGLLTVPLTVLQNANVFSLVLSVEKVPLLKDKPVDQLGKLMN